VAISFDKMVTWLSNFSSDPVAGFGGTYAKTGKEKEKHQPRSKRVIKLPIFWGSNTTYLWLGGGNSNIFHFHPETWGT